MNRIAAVVIALGALVAVARAEPLPTEPLRLPNGVRVVLAPDATVATVVVHVRVAGTGGDAGELIQHALDHDFDAKLDDVGGWSTSVTAPDHASYALEVPREALERALFLDAERFAHLDAKAAEATRAEVDRERAASAGTRGAIVATALGTGTVAPVRATGQDIAAVQHRMYDPLNLTVVVAGNIDRRAGVAVAKYFGALRPASKMAKARAQLDTPMPAHPGVLHDARADRVTVAFAVPPALSAASLDLDVAARVLAARLAKQGAAGLEIRIDPPFTIEAAVTSAAVAVRAREAIVDELRALRDAPISRDELARAVAMVDLEKVIAIENLAYRAQAIAEAVAIAETPRYLETWRGLLHAVTARSVQATAASWLAGPKAIVVIGDAR